MNDGYDSLINLLPTLENETILKYMDDKNNFYFFQSKHENLFYFDFINKNVSLVALEFNKYLEKKWAKVNKLPYQELTFEQLKQKIIPKQIFKRKMDDAFDQAIFTYVDNSSPIYDIDIKEHNITFSFSECYLDIEDFLNSKWVIIG